MIKADNSWLRIPRSFTGWQWYEDSNMVHLYLHLLLNASLLDTTRCGVAIKRGENLTSLRKIEENTGLSIQNIRTGFSRLVKSREIKFKKVKNLRLVILVDFNKYQPIGVDEIDPDWVKLYRNICDWNYYKKPDMVHLIVHFMQKGGPVIQPDGTILWQLITSYRKLEKETGLSFRSIRTCLKNLEKTGKIAVSLLSTHQISIITLYNYDSYNVDFQPLNTEITQFLSKEYALKGSFKKSLSTQQNLSVTTCKYDTYQVETQSNQHNGNTVGTRDCVENSTDCQHKVNMETAKQIYKNERIKDYFFVDDARERACVREEDFGKAVEIESEGEKENEQKKARKESFADVVQGDQQWLDAIRRKFKLPSLEAVKEKVSDFELDLLCRGKNEHKDEKDYKCHFCDWLKGSLSETSFAPSNIPYRQKERWAGEYYVPKSSEGGLYEGKI